jgi:glycosyltransferase involved in cell wall biosynthesis
MAAAKPIVLFEGSAKGLQHLQQAIVVPDHDWQALGQGIITLLQDRSLAQALGLRARQWADEHLSWPRIAGKIEQVYAAILQRPGWVGWEQTTPVGLEPRQLDDATTTGSREKVHAL